MSGAGYPPRRWFERREVVLGSAVCLTVAIFALRGALPGRDEMLGLLYVIPVALTGLELGLRGGVGAALGALLLVAIHPLSSDPALGALGVATRGVALMSVGAIAGRFSDRMRDAQTRMQEHFRSAEHVLGVHERERRGIAEQLHDHTAQTMAAALLLVSRLEPRSLDGMPHEHVQEVRESVRDCIARLRELAATLRPPVLDELGLGAALERLSDSHQRVGPISILPSAGALRDRLAPGTETLAYRAIEEILSCMAGPVRVRLDVDAARAVRLEIDGQPSDHCAPSARQAAFATTQARLKIVGGAMWSDTTDRGMRVVMELPVHERRDPQVEVAAAP